MLEAIKNVFVSDWTLLDTYARQYQKLHLEIYESISLDLDYTMSKEYEILKDVMSKSKYSKSSRKNSFETAKDRILRDIEIPFLLMKDTFD